MNNLTLLILGFLIVAAIIFIVGCANVSRQNSEGAEPENKNEQAFLLYLKLSDAQFGTDAERDACFKLEEKLEKAVADAKVGELDGNEFGGGECTIFIYGPDADAIEKVAKPYIEEFKPRAGSHYLKRYGSVEDENAKEVDTPLG